MTLTTAAVVVAVLATTAGARRDDLQPEARSPADGTTIADATHGIDVRFPCPPTTRRRTTPWSTATATATT